MIIAGTMKAGVWAGRDGLEQLQRAHISNHKMKAKRCNPFETSKPTPSDSTSSKKGTRAPPRPHFQQ